MDGVIYAGIAVFSIIAAVLARNEFWLNVVMMSSSGAAWLVMMTRVETGSGIVYTIAAYLFAAVAGLYARQVWPRWSRKERKALRLLFPQVRPAWRALFTTNFWMTSPKERAK